MTSGSKTIPDPPTDDFAPCGGPLSTRINADIHEHGDPPRVKNLRVYDSISSSYVSTRRADPRIAARIHARLGNAQTVINIGAGTGNYEPTDRVVVAVEPSDAMIGQRTTEATPVVRAAAEDLPFLGATFDLAMAVLTVHHWQDWRKGLSEMRRVAQKQMILLFEPAMINHFWAMDGQYWPEAFSLPSERDAIGTEQVREVLDVCDVVSVPIPNDCTDGFGAAFWSRPEAYLDPRVQQGMSWLALLTPEERARGAERLESDLRSGEWDRRHGYLRRLDQLDVGYRLVVATS